eukprot:1427866-Rhodomonas_salina.3
MPSRVWSRKLENVSRTCSVDESITASTCRSSTTVRSPVCHQHLLSDIDLNVCSATFKVASCAPRRMPFGARVLRQSRRLLPS